MKPAKLVLSNGMEFSGFTPDYCQDSQWGEVVFNTGMTGYEETLTDPSYAGQILVFTYPILGNYGVGDGSEWESDKIHVYGVICETLMEQSEHYQQQQTFTKWLQSNKIPLLCGVDTRELTKVIRVNGVLDGIITDKIDAKVTYSEHPTINYWVKGLSNQEIKQSGSGNLKVILVDCGMKTNILRELEKYPELSIKCVPYNYDYSDEDFDGVLLSNGPGDPTQCQETVEILAKVISKTNKPIFGICLGSQLMALSIGAQTYKLKFGHRGHNQPCIDVTTNKCYLTSQNHGYAIIETTLPENWDVSFYNLNDKTVAGIKHKEKPFFSVQFHPEAASGPEDTAYLFDQFVAKIKQGAK